MAEPWMAAATRVLSRLLQPWEKAEQGGQVAGDSAGVSRSTAQVPAWVPSYAGFSDFPDSRHNFLVFGRNQTARRPHRDAKSRTVLTRVDHWDTNRITPLDSAGYTASGDDPIPEFRFLVFARCAFDRVPIMFAMLQDLVRHKGYANTCLLRAIRQHETAAQDEELRKLLHYIILANRFLAYRTAIRARRGIPESPDAIAAQYRESTPGSWSGCLELMNPKPRRSRRSAIMRACFCAGPADDENRQFY